MLTDVAVRLFSEKGAEALSVSGLAREAGVNRTTVYYHFNSRDEMVAAIRDWSAQQLAKAFAPVAPQQDRARYITRFALEKAELMKLWIEDFLSPGDIRTRYPEWDRLVAGTRARLDAGLPDEAIDAEVYCAILLTVAMVAPRVYVNSVRPDLDPETAIARFTAEQMRMLRRDTLAEEG